MNFNFLNPITDTSKSLGEVASDLFSFVLIVAGILSFAYFVYGGIMFIISQGDSGKVTNARNTLIYAIVGMIVIVFAYVIVRWIGKQLH